MARMIKIIYVENGKPTEARELDASLESMQETVGGLIEMLMPFDDDAALICCDEGKLRGYPLNRALYNEQGELYDIIAGTFFICRAPSDSERFESLTDEQLAKYLERFRAPEEFIRINGMILSVPLE